MLTRPDLHEPMPEPEIVVRQVADLVQPFVAIAAAASEGHRDIAAGLHPASLDLLIASFTDIARAAKRASRDLTAAKRTVRR